MPPSGKNTNDVKRALRQNAGAFITAKRTFRGNDGRELTAEISDTRYGVVFASEKFPNGSRADAVYILLHEAYREVLNAAPTRPLDYDYLKDLSPCAQRVYELLSFQFFAALRNQRPRTKLLYSYYCARAPQTRYVDYDHVKKQMYNLHAPHRRAGYISAVEVRQTTDGQGQPDWEMLYTPGRRAKAEFRAFTQTKKVMVPKSIGSLPPSPQLKVREPETVADPNINALEEQLRQFGITEDKARELVKSHREAVEAQISAYPYRAEKTLPGGLSPR